MSIFDPLDKQAGRRSVPQSAAGGVYLGFYVKNEGIVLRRVENVVSTSEPVVVIRPVAELFDRG